MTTIDRDEMRETAEEQLEWGGFGDDLANGVLALLDALTRAEAQSETRRLDIGYWKERAEQHEMALRLAEAGEEVQTSERYSNAVALAQAVQRADRAEARIQAVREWHSPDDPDLPEPLAQCLWDGETYPCSTLRILNGDNPHSDA